MTIEAPRRIRPTRWFAHSRTIPHLISMLDTRVRALECAHDRRATYCRYYRDTVAATNLHAASQDTPAASWVPRIELEIARAYLHAMEMWNRGEFALVPGPWRAVFADNRRTARTDDAAIRISSLAHIAYDLPLAIARRYVCAISSSMPRSHAAAEALRDAARRPVSTTASR